MESSHEPRIDHVVLAARDISAAADHILQTTGLAGHVGGRHEGLGTENYIIPLSEGYLEIAGVYDRQAAESCDFGRLILAGANRVTEAQPWALVAFCVEVPEGAVAAAERLGQEHARMRRRRPDGGELAWSVAGASRFQEQGRAPKPFFIAWDDPSTRPDKAAAGHRVRPLGIAYVEVSGDEAAMRSWVGAELPLRWAAGEPGLRAVGISTEAGMIILH